MHWLIYKSRISFCDKLFIQVASKYMYRLLDSVQLKTEFLISQPKHMLWVLKRIVSMKQTLKLMDMKIFTILNFCFVLFLYGTKKLHLNCVSRIQFHF